MKCSCFCLLNRTLQSLNRIVKRDSPVNGTVAHSCLAHLFYAHPAHTILFGLRDLCGCDCECLIADVDICSCLELLLDKISIGWKIMNRSWAQLSCCSWEHMLFTLGFPERLRSSDLPSLWYEFVNSLQQIRWLLLSLTLLAEPCRSNRIYSVCVL